VATYASLRFVQHQAEDKRKLRTLTVIDEFTMTCLEIVVAWRLRSDDVLHYLTELLTRHGPPEHIRSDNGPDFVANRVRSWLSRIGVKALYIEPDIPWENSCRESFNSKLATSFLKARNSRRFPTRKF